MNGKQFLAEFHAIAKMERETIFRREALLQACGWKHSSSNPACRWTWAKDFPKSIRQWRWVSSPDGLSKKSPCPPQSFNGVSTETALDIECGWRMNYEDDLEQRTTIDEAD